MNPPHNFRLLYGSRKPLPEEILQESRSLAANYHFTACICIFVFSHPFYSFAKAKEIAKYEEENGITPAEKIASWPSNGLSDIRNEAL